MGLHTLTAEIEWHGTVQGSVSVRFDRFDGDRCQYHYEIKDRDGNVLAEGDDLRSGSSAEPNHAEMLSALLGFLQSPADKWQDPCRMWAESLGDELEMARAELVGRERAGY